MNPKAMKEIMSKNMKPIAEPIRQKAPLRDEAGNRKIIRYRKDGSHSTESLPGNLKKSIGVKTFGKGGEITAYAGIQKKKNDGWYGFFLERGTQHIPKKPFIAPASSASIPIAAANLESDVKDYIVKNAKKLGLDAK
jgi:HK97 gp10 family phage protein